MATLPMGAQAEEVPEAVVADARKGRLTKERRERVRAEATREIPWWYSPWGHLAATTGIGLATIGVSVWRVATRGARASDFLIIPLVLLASNFFEWLVHKDVLHKRRWPVEVIYDKHTPMHHIMYVEDDMALRSTKEFRLVLIPAMGVLGIVLASAPIAIVVGQLWSPAAGWLMLATAGFTMAIYEVLHLCYHAPADSFIGRLGFIRVMRAHHARHHDPTLMQKWNFNVTVPLFDWIMGTIAKRD